MGLLEQAQQQGQAPVAPEVGYVGDGDQPNVSPEEQAQYDQFMDNAYKLIYSENTMPKVLERIDASPSPVEAVANIAASTVIRLEESAAEAGKPISPDVAYRGGEELVEELADMVADAGIHDFTKEEMDQVWLQSLDIYANLKQQSGDTGHQQAAEQDMAALDEADQAGQLAEMLPGLDQRGV